MISEFEAEARHENFLRQTRNKWHKVNQHIEDTAEMMKERRERIYNEKRKALMKEQKKREENIKKILNFNMDSAYTERQKCLQRIILKEQTVKEKHDRKLSMDEKDRKINEQKTFSRLQLFVERNESIKKISQQKYQNKLSVSDLRHEKNMKVEMERKARIMSENHESVINRYIKLYWNRRRAENERKEKTERKKRKYLERNERMEDIKKEMEKNRKLYYKRMQTADAIKLKNKNNYDEERVNKMKNKRNEYNNYLKNNIILLKKQRSTGIEELLEKEKNLMHRNMLKTNYRDNLSKTAKEKAVMSQMNFEKNLKPFYRQLEGIKSGSMLKKSLESKKKLYKDLKREEAAKKKKEEEERLEKLYNKS